MKKLCVNNLHVQEISTNEMVNLNGGGDFPDRAIVLLGDFLLWINPKTAPGMIKDAITDFFKSLF